MTCHSAEKDALAPLLADGFDHYEHEHLKPGVRVRNRGEQYDTARQFGTAEIVAVLRKPGAWERDWGRLNIEVLVKRDRDGSLTWWADYGTFLTEGCWLCGGTGRDYLDTAAPCRGCPTPPGEGTP